MLEADADDEFIHAVADAVIGLIVAVERGDRMMVIGETNRLLTTIVERGNKRTRKAEALRRAVERV